MGHKSHTLPLKHSKSILDGTAATQVNQIVSHPTMSLLVTAHEDKFIRIFDFTTGKT